MTTSQPPVKRNKIGEELEEKAPDRLPTEAEVENRSKERIAANGGLIDKTLKMLVDKKIVTASEVDNFVLPNRNVKIHALRESIADLTEQINSVTLADPEAKLAALESSRSVLVTELLYSVTGFAKKVVLDKVNSLIIELRSEKESNGTLNVQKVEQLKEIQSFTPHWEALVTNSVDIMKYFRSKHDADVTNTLLGMLNESLYLAVNKDTSDLNSTEQRSGGGTLADEMSEVTSRLQRLFRINLDVLIQPQRNVAPPPQPEAARVTVAAQTKEVSPVAPPEIKPQTAEPVNRDLVPPTVIAPLQSEKVLAEQPLADESAPSFPAQPTSEVVGDISEVDPEQLKDNPVLSS